MKTVCAVEGRSGYEVLECCATISRVGGLIFLLLGPWSVSSGQGPRNGLLPEVSRIVEEAKRAADRVHDPYQRPAAVGKVAGAYTRLGNLQAATNMANDLIYGSCTTGIWFEVIEALSEQGKVEAAMQAVDSYPDIPERSARKLDVLMKRGEAADLEGVRRAADFGIEALYVSRALLSVARVSANRGNRERSTTALREAQARTALIQRPSHKVDGLMELALAQSQLGDSSAAAATSKQALVLAQDIDAKDRGQWWPDGIRASLAGFQAGVGDLDVAWTTARSVTSEVGRNDAILSIARAQARAGSAENALTTLAAVTNETVRIEAEADLVRVLFEAGHTDVARSIAVKLPEPYGAYSLVMAVLEQIDSGESTPSAQDIDEVHRIVRAQTNTAYKVWLMQYVAIAQYHARDVRGAEQTIRLAEQMSHQAQAGRFDDEYWRKVVQAQVDAGDFAGAERTMRRFQSGWHRGQAHRTIAMAGAKNGQYLLAIANAGSIHDATLRTITTREVAKLQSEAGHAARAYSWARRKRSPLDRATALVGVVEGIVQRQRKYGNKSPVQQ